MRGLRVAGLCVSIHDHQVLNGVDLEVTPGTCAGLVGESGSGKSMTALAALGLTPRGAVVNRGEILLGEQVIVGPGVDRTSAIRGSGIAMIFQSPRAALNPVLRAGQQVERILRRKGYREDLKKRTAELLGSVGLLEPDKIARRYPHELSGGMCQRVLIAMGIASEPSVLIADEPTTALDVTVQADILDLLDDLRARTGMGMLLISHDLSVVAERCGSISVMQSGQVVEAGPTAAVLTSPKHEFTAALVRDLVAP